MSPPKLSARSRTTLAAIRRRGSASRSELIRDLGLSGTAVFRATEELEAAGLVRSGETVATGRGQPSVMIHMEPDAAFSLGLSVMTDRADVVLIDLAGSVRARRQITLPGMPRAAMVDAAVSFGLDQMATVGIDRRRLLGMGVAVAGYFVGPSMVNPGRELEEWALVDLKEATERQTGLPTSVENIANAAALGERMLGVAARYDSFCYVNVAAGFGAGIVMNGTLVRGRYGNAGEIAGLFTSSGRATPNLMTLRDRLADHGIACSGMSDLITHFDPTWPGVDEWLAEHQESFSYLFGALRMTLDCEALILGGRLPRVLARRIVDAIDLPENHWPVRRERRAPPTVMDVASLEPELSGPLGAASLIFHQTLFD
ncbi:ROK family transcriptional regulator [Brevundimonas sp. SORGH_AS_0993]|uniref:ROK family transcriptional regulator n=1 Tax=Brevundimonas sp. SORGH_AS_0993 TaxID=3041794 RepID=UPI0027896F49|nr:ROK family transcriptional regulator [Brevundimonas sp. SORGH_AS_0993]MDQ1154382.1 putative NBD/HSP70 family sugar kinase [Brevundimonas sp. SORGH_AS_0993]